MDNVTSRLLKYVKVNTISDPKSETLPSTQIQFDLAKILLVLLVIVMTLSPSL